MFTPPHTRLPIRCVLALLWAACGAATRAQTPPEPEPAPRAAESGGDDAAWRDCLIPLPHELQVAGLRRLPPGALGLCLAPDASAMLVRAADALRADYRRHSGCEPTGAVFVVRVGRLGPDGHLDGHPVADAPRLRRVPAPDQAYLIRPLGDSGLAVAAWTDRGVFYGLQTLAQLLTARLTPDTAVVPLAAITDWPDLDERGAWNIGYLTDGFIPWLASLKLNFTVAPTSLILKPDAPAECPPLPMDVIRRARDVAFLVLPHAPHYDYWYRYGVTTLYPDLVGQGESARNPAARLYPDVAKFQAARCPCASNPALRTLAADWIRGAARQGARDVALWLTEFYPCECACPRCGGAGQFARETAASVDAIRAVQLDFTNLTGRIFFTLTAKGSGDRDSADCLALLPPAGIKAEKVYGRNRAFDEYAAGHWVASYDGPRFHFPLRFAWGARARALVRGFHSNRYSAVYSLGWGKALGPEDTRGDFERQFGDFYFHALAEWTWNADGRDLRELARAYAARRRVPEPARFAEWLEAMEPAQTLFLDTRYSGLWDQALDTVSSRRPLPEKFPAPAPRARALEACRRAAPAADASGDPAAVLETRFLQSYCSALQNLAAAHAARTVPPGSEPDAGDGTRWLDAAGAALADSATSLEQHLALLPAGPHTGRDVVLTQHRDFVNSARNRLAALRSGI